MNLRLACITMLATSTAAFAPSAFGVPKLARKQQHTVTAVPADLTTPQQQLISLGQSRSSIRGSSRLFAWRPPMKMVAGGAERAYGDEYYDGKKIPRLSSRFGLDLSTKIFMRAAELAMTLTETISPF